MKVLTLLIGILLLFHSAVAQTKQEIENTYNCDAMLGIIDDVVRDAALDSNKDNVVIIVAYLGRGEKSNLYNHQRLNALEIRLTKIRGLSKERLVLTEGKKRNGLGKVEFYVGGKLINKLFLEKKGRICTSCCPAEFGS